MNARDSVAAFFALVLIAFFLVAYVPLLNDTLFGAATPSLDTLRSQMDTLLATYASGILAMWLGVKPPHGDPKGFHALGGRLFPFAANAKLQGLVGVLYAVAFAAIAIGAFIAFNQKGEATAAPLTNLLSTFLGIAFAAATAFISTR